jgi:glycosyltransferase involved in cell wall biosynthesis
MRIAFDLRGLHSGKISGVENYIVNILERLIYMDHSNQYTLFDNALRPKNYSHLKFVNAKVVQRRLPNKLLNLSLLTTGRPHFESFIGEFDCLFLPNFNFFSISPKSKLIVTAHDLSPFIVPEHFNQKMRLWHKLINFRRTLNRADKVIAVSEYTKQDLMRLFNVPGEKITVVYPGIDQKIYHPNLPESRLRQVRNIYGLPGEYILFLNTLEPRKNLVNFISAYERSNTSVPLVIGGKKGWKYQPIFDKINQSSKRRLIKYLGYIPEDDKPYIIRLAQTVVYPSFYEGFGFPALEAMSLGVPVLTSQTTSLPESVEDAALLVNPFNLDDMAHGLEQILEDAELRQKLTSKGLQQVQKFDWNRSAEQLLEVINSLR